MAIRIRFEAFDALNPEQAKELWICGDFAESIRKCNVVKYLRLRLVKPVTENPIRVYQGLREGFEDGQCYVGRPGNDWTEGGVEIPPKPGLIFAVFVTGGGKVFDWRWEAVHDGDEFHLEDYIDRFGRVIWPPIQSN